MNWNELRKRRGQFAISQECFEDALDSVRALLANVVVIRCDMDFASDGFEYTALCEDFEPVELGRSSPHYLVSFTKQGDGTFKCALEKAMAA